LADAESVSDEWGRLDNRWVSESQNGSDGGRRSLDSRRSLDAHREFGSGRGKRVDLGLEPYVRSSTSMSLVRTPSSPTKQRNIYRERERERKPGVFSGFSSRKFFTARRSDRSPTVGNSSFSSDTNYSSPTPARPQSGSVRVPSRPNPFSSDRPPLSTVPSESHLTSSPEKRSRRSKTSTTSNATVRGSAILPSGGSALPTQLTTTSVVAGPPDGYRAHSSSLSRSSGSVIAASLHDPDSPTSEREQRKRTLSETSESYGDLSSPISVVSPTDRRGFRQARASLDSPQEDRPREGRRKTIGGLFN